MSPSNGNGLEEHLEVLREYGYQMKRHTGEFYAIMSHFSPELKELLSKMVTTFEKSEENITKAQSKRLDDFDKRVDAKIKQIDKRFRFFTLKGFISLSVASIIFSIFLGHRLSEDLYFKEARIKKILQHESDISIMETLRKRGIHIDRKVILIPVEATTEGSKTEDNKYLILLKP